MIEFECYHCHHWSSANDWDESTGADRCNDVTSITVKVERTYCWFICPICDEKVNFINPDGDNMRQRTYQLNAFSEDLFTL